MTRTAGYAGRVLRRVLRSKTTRVLFVLVALGFLAAALVSSWQEAKNALVQLSVPAVLGAQVAVLGGLFLLFLAWRALLADLGSQLPVGPAMRVLFTGQLGKYVPGSIWPFVAQMELAKKYHVPRRRTATASVLGMIFTLAVGLVVAAATLPLAATAAARTYWPALALVPLLLILLYPRVLNPLLNTALRLVRQQPLERPLSLRGTAVAFGWTLAAWMCFGGHSLLLTVGAGASAGLRVVPVAVGAYALGWSVGFLFVVAPAGAGAREAGIIAGLSPVLPAGSALVVALVSRLVMTLGDLLSAGLAVLVYRRRKPEAQALVQAAAQPDGHDGGADAGQPATDR